MKFQSAQRVSFVGTLFTKVNLAMIYLVKLLVFFFLTNHISVFPHQCDSLCKTLTLIRILNSQSIILILYSHCEAGAGDRQECYNERKEKKPRHTYIFISLCILISNPVLKSTLPFIILGLRNDPGVPQFWGHYSGAVSLDCVFSHLKCL